MRRNEINSLTQNKTRCIDILAVANKTACGGSVSFVYQIIWYTFSRTTGRAGARSSGKAKGPDRTPGPFHGKRKDLVYEKNHNTAHQRGAGGKHGVFCLPAERICLRGGTGPENGVSTQTKQDITNSGIALNGNTPTQKTTYQAGTGTVTYDPDSKTLTLENATIETKENTIVAPDGVLNIVVIGKNTLTSTDENVIYCTEDTTDIKISGDGVLNINAGEYGITDEDEQTSVSIQNARVNFKCKNDAVYVTNKVEFDGAQVKLQGVDDYKTLYENDEYIYGIEVFDTGLVISNSTVEIENYVAAFSVGRNNESRLLFDVSNSNVTVKNVVYSTIAANAQIKNSIYVQEDGYFSREGSTTVENSTFIVKTADSTAFDSWYGGLNVLGDSYVELEGSENALVLTKTEECLTLDDDLAILEGEMETGMKKSTTKRLVIGKRYSVGVENGTIAENKTTARYNEEVSFTARDVQKGEKFTGWTFNIENVEFVNGTTASDSTVTVKMPAANLTATANFEKEKYTIKVTGGTAVKKAEYNTRVELTVDKDAFPNGQEFDCWKCDNADVKFKKDGDVWYFDMPATNVEITAVYKDAPIETYNVIINGKVAGTYAKDAKITLTAKEPTEEEVFTGWKVVAPETLNVTTNGRTINFTMPAADVELKAIYDAKTITELNPDEYEGLEKNEELGGVTVKEDYELKLPETVVVKEPVENKGTIVSGRFEEPVTGGTIQGGTYLEVRAADAVTGGVFAQKPEVKQSGKINLMDLLKVVDADDNLMEQCSVNDIIVPQSTEKDVLYAENSIENVAPVAYIIGEQTVTVKYTGTSDKFVGWTSQDIDMTKAVVSDNGKTLTFNVTAIGDKVVIVKATYKADEPVKHLVTVSNGEQPAVELPYAQGETVTLTADDVESKSFTGWTVEGLADFTESPAQVLRFTMPGNDVAVTAHYRTNEAPRPVVTEPGPLVTAVGTAAFAGVVAVPVYAAATEVYIRTAMPVGILLPSNRIELAELLWQQAGKPEPASAELFEDIAADDTDAQKAARWVVEQGLLKVREDKPAEFRAAKVVTRLRVCLTWHEAKAKGLIQ